MPLEMVRNSRTFEDIGTHPEHTRLGRLTVPLGQPDVGLPGEIFVNKHTLHGPSQIQQIAFVTPIHLAEIAAELACLLIDLQLVFDFALNNSFVIILNIDNFVIFDDEDELASIADLIPRVRIRECYLEKPGIGAILNSGCLH
jgi:hypothetical protein